MKQQMLRILVEILTVVILVCLGLAGLTYTLDAQERKKSRDMLFYCKDTYPGGLEYKATKDGCFVRVNKTIWLHEEKLK